jgi:hypothetical protein
MKNTKNNWWKIILIIIFCGLMNLILHRVFSPLESSNIASTEPGFFIKNGLLVPAVICWELLTFGVFSVVFTLIQTRLPGKRLTKGLLFGLSFGGLYFVGMFESVLLLNSSILNELLMGLTDFVTFVLAGVLLGIFTGIDSRQDKNHHNLTPVFYIAAFYIIGRYFAYSVLHIQSTYISRPIETLVWTICLGLWVGMICFILQSGLKGKSYIAQALFFGIVVFGSNWLINHLFIGVVAGFSSDLFIRAGIDSVFSSLGLLTYNKFCKKMIKFANQI